MSRRLAVLPGTGLVIRYGELVIWTGPQASSSLISFLIEGAKNLSTAGRAGGALADHLALVLANRDPEPAAPFVTIGPGEQGLDALLHGPVQLWDGSRWLVVAPAPGWRRDRVSPLVTLIAGPAGVAPPQLIPGSPIDLVAGVVPGGGLALLALTPAPPPPPSGETVDR